MIKENYVRSYCKEDPSLIENYDKAIADSTQMWCCHHRLEISEGKSYQQLKSEGLYWQRPASELIFMTKSDHQRLHNEHRSLETLAKLSAASKGHLVSKDTRKKMSAAHKGEKSYMYGKPKSAETKQKISEAQKGEKSYMYGKNLSVETRKRMSDAKKNMSAETRKKMSDAKKGRHCHLENCRRIYTD